MLIPAHKIHVIIISQDFKDTIRAITKQMKLIPMHKNAMELRDDSGNTPTARISNNAIGNKTPIKMGAHCLSDFDAIIFKLIVEYK